MKTEVSYAATYLVDEMRKTLTSTEDKLLAFKSSLEKLLCERFVDHWHPSEPMKGNAFRCLNIEQDFVDPILVRAARESDLSIKTFADSFPKGLALWIDPSDVSCRCGPGRGNIQPIYKRIAKSPSPVTVLPNATLDQNKETMKAALKFNPWETRIDTHINFDREHSRFDSLPSTTFFKPFYANKSVSWKKPTMKKNYQLQYTGQEFVPNASRHISSSYQGGYELRRHPQLVY